MISRRHLLAAVALAPGAALLEAGRADAARPFIVQDNAVRDNGGVLFIGDSTSGGFRSDLLRQLRKTTLGPYRLDIGPVRSILKSSTIMYSGLEAIRRSRVAGFHPSTIVIALGANDLKYGIRTPELAAYTFDRVMTEAGPGVTVGFFNMYSAKSRRAPSFNKYLYEATKRWPDLLIVDWASLAKRHRSWHKADGFHFNLGGARQRNTFVLQAMVDVSVAHAEAYPPPTTTTTTPTTTTTTLA